MQSLVLENFNHFVIALFFQLVLAHRAYKKRWGLIVVCLGLMNAVVALTSGINANIEPVHELSGQWVAISILSGFVGAFCCAYLWYWEEQSKEDLFY